MTKRLELRLRAQADLLEIQTWILETFGLVQTEKYMDNLRSAIALLRDPDPIRQPLACSRLTGQPRHGALALVRSGRHLIVYHETSEEIAVIAVLHSASDIVGRLDTLLNQMKDH